MFPRNLNKYTGKLMDGGDTTLENGPILRSPGFVVCGTVTDQLCPSKTGTPSLLGDLAAPLFVRS